MCACTWNWTCSRCEPRRRVDLGVPDWRETEQEQQTYDLSRVDFREPFNQ